jgi:hypothetical protein
MTLNRLNPPVYDSSKLVSILAGLVRRVSEAAKGAATGNQLQERTCVLWSW